MAKEKIISQTVIVLSLVSLFTDTASEMLYPVMPVYLKQIGFSVLLIGILEGIAEAIAGLSKGYFGNYSDKLGRRAPFVQAGYALSALSKPMMAVLIAPWWVFIARCTDRIGKGIRTGARDAILSDEATPKTKAQIFGFHRAMDTIGAVLGPVLALIYLYFYPENYKNLFLLALVPGVLAIVATFYLKDKTINTKGQHQKPGFLDFTKYWKTSPNQYRKLVIGLLLFALFNSSDIFLLLQAKENGLNDSQVIFLYVFYNLIYALAAYPMGILADKLGLKNIMLFGLLIFSLVYWCMSQHQTTTIYFILFALYGLYASATEGVSKAWISNISEKKDTATAIGTFSAFQSLCAMLASALAGALWFRFGANIALLVTAIMSFVVVIYFLIFKIQNPNTTT